MQRVPKRPWSADRWGRLLAGTSFLILTSLGLLHHPGWFIGTLVGSAMLVISSLTDRCLLHDLLIRFDVKEREDLFLPGGAVRPEIFKADAGPAGAHKSVNAVRTEAAVGQWH